MLSTKAADLVWTLTPPLQDGCKLVRQRAYGICVVVA